MVTDRQFRRLIHLMKNENSLTAAAAKAGMDEKTARKYRDLGRPPGEVKAEHTWRTRSDPFSEVWEEMAEKLRRAPGLEAKTLFADLQRRFPGRFGDGQLRTLQRRVKVWRATEGTPREVFFAQLHRPGELCQSDFTHMGALGVTICGQPFDHLIYHFVLTYSNWETGTICFSESMESLSEGLQNALWELGAVPGVHQSDRMSAAVQKPDHPEEFTQRYSALMRHYGLQGRKIQTGRPNENGDVEQRHYRFKRAVDQTLMLRGSRDFAARADYSVFLRKVFAQLNAGRRERLAEEWEVMHSLPQGRIEAFRRLEMKVSVGSTIRVQHNTYSVNSRLIGERVRVRLYAKHLEVWYAQRRMETIARLRGENKHRIEYRHVIDTLVRKPGAFENYRYREDLFPTIRFRMLYDHFCNRTTTRQAAKQYLAILNLAAKENETAIDEALACLFDQGTSITFEAIQAYVQSDELRPESPEPIVASVDLMTYDHALLSGAGAV